MQLKDQDIINFILEHKHQGRRKISLYMTRNKLLTLGGTKNRKGITRRLIDWTPEGNQIQYIFCQDDLVYLGTFDRKINNSTVIYKTEGGE